GTGRRSCRSAVRRRHAVDAQDMRELIEAPPIDFGDQFALPMGKSRQRCPAVRTGDKKELLKWKLPDFRSHLQVVSKISRQVIGDRLRIVAEDRLSLPGVRRQTCCRLPAVV